MTERAERSDTDMLVLLGAAQSVHVRRWASALAARGHRVVVTSWLPAEPLAHVEIRTPEPVVGARAGRTSRAGRVLRMLSTARWLRREIRRVRPDVVHVHSVGRAGLLSLALPRHAVRVVTPWGSDLRFAARSRLRGWVASAVLRRADLVVPTSRSVTREVTDRYRIPAHRATTVSWGVDDDFLCLRDTIDRRAVRAELGVPVDGRVIISMRGAGQVYRTDDIVRAFRTVAPDCPDLHLIVLAGHEPADGAAAGARADCLERVRTVGRELPERLTLVERTLPPADVFRLMRASDLAVSIPRWDQRSSAVLEAALAGCRLLLADLPAYHELLADGLVAELVTEPVADHLPGMFRAAAPLPPAEQLHNRHFIETSELWSRQVEVMRELYRRVSGPPGPRRRDSESSDPTPATDRSDGSGRRAYGKQGHRDSRH
ncbi:glycosyltransferase family 4 protein [Micromonospora endolithica]|uniref:Glycosyltransferase subfamily 4-like N-terminal domain-containing protein n=1 Tax=Micromonospora endolithica TaxID=230091 RepID=A0A3A9ZB84_9ACTN|nr:glycosyltransferase family 4 protein [Micromonospora endolithica]RKN45475.1 hypothetical protein D7223_17945 [Micromonospora endolithica]TWJ22799.1 glycosyltransferase involved in cell wall biosynthesis [Micromonospora endolithica]